MHSLRKSLSETWSVRSARARVMYLAAEPFFILVLPSELCDAFFLSIPRDGRFFSEEPDRRRSTLA
jgi:hypothetical protein